MDSSEEWFRKGALAGSVEDAEESDEDVQSLSVSENRSVPFSADSDGPSRSGAGMDQHRDMMLASLLEDYYRSRAADFLNATNPGKNYTRQSTEVQPLARRLFAQASHTLSSNGLLPSVAVADGSQKTRIQYLAGLDNLGAGTAAPATSLLDPMRDLQLSPSDLALALMPHPANDLQLTIQPPRPLGHYHTSFQEVKLLGKGGFGRVYKCFNSLDQTAYAVKKIPIPAKLGKCFREGRHGDARHVLREVQALAMLDHCNVVRYHATWFEEPQQQTRGFDEHIQSPTQKRLLLDTHSFNSGSEEDETEESVSGGIVFGESVSGGIVFGEDTPSITGDHDNLLLAKAPLWSEQATSDRSAVQTLSSTSDIFTDGNHSSKQVDDTRMMLGERDHLLYIQMSIYPMTLAEYISPSNSGRGSTSKHCFHIGPSLRLLQSILAGLRYIHARGFIHRDIKPGNIFLSSPENTGQSGYCEVTCSACPEDKREDPTRRWLNPRIGDFGLVAELAHGEVPSPIHEAGPSQATESSSLVSYNPVGTAYYRPPSWKGSIDEKIDIFALGVVFVEMLCLCGTAMERVDMLQGLQKGQLPDSLRKCIEEEGCSEEQCDKVLHLVRGMVDPDPDQRWPGTQVEERLRDVIRGLSTDEVA